MNKLKILANNNLLTISDSDSDKVEKKTLLSIDHCPLPLTYCIEIA